jgi:tetratricopeptide (TPR) repeat protein
MDGRKARLVLLPACLFLGALGCSRKEVRTPFDQTFPSGTQPITGVPMTTAKKPFWGGSNKPATPVQVATEPRKKGPPETDTIVAFADVQLEAALDEKTPPANRESLLDSARRGYQKALQQDPKSHRGLLGLARYYSRIGDTAKAVEMYKQYLTLYPTDKDVAHEVAMAHAKWKDWAGAVAWCQFTLKIDPENLAVRKTMAFCLARDNKWEKGFEVMLEVMPEAQARYLIARVLEHQNQPEKARLQVQMALNADPNFADAREFLMELDAVLTPGSAPPSHLRQVDYRDQ